MKRIMVICLISFPLFSFAQQLLKVGGGIGNRWNERLNSQTLGKGFRVSGEQFINKQFTIGLEVSWFSFNPTTLVNVRFNSFSLKGTYYFAAGKIQPYLGAGVGYTSYADKTSIDIGNGNLITQKRAKNYGVVSPFLGLHYKLGNKKPIGVFLQVNADFIPVAKIAPIGFVSVSAGISYRLHPH